MGENESPGVGIEPTSLGHAQESRSVYETAKAALGERLWAVAESLPLAAIRLDDNIEHVHKLRVNTRRAIAALSLYKELLPRKETKWLRKQLGAIRGAAGHARNLDVVIARMRRKWDQNNGQWTSELARQRDKAQKPIEKIQQRLSSAKSLDDRIQRILSGIECASSKGMLDVNSNFDWVWRRLRPDVKRFFKLLRCDLHGEERQHRLRIFVKKLRYSIDLLPPEKSSRGLDELQAMLKELQKLIGKIRDSSIARRLLRKLGKSESGSSAKKLRRWWRIEKRRQSRLQVELDELLSNKTRSLSMRDFCN
jgi:CHAD domain-containing protein